MAAASACTSLGPRSLAPTFDSRRHIVLRKPPCHCRRGYQRHLNLSKDWCAHTFSKDISSQEQRKSRVSKIWRVSSSLGQESSNEGDGQRNRRNAHTWIQHLQSPAQILRRVSTYGVKVLAFTHAFFCIGIVGAPAFLSTRFGLSTVVGLANMLIPGHAQVQTVKLGWNRPILIKGISMKGVDGELVLSIPKVETKASLWQLIQGKVGLGDCTITGPFVDLQQDRTNGLLKVALALAPAKKLLRSQKPAKQSTLHDQKKTMSIDISLEATVKDPVGGLRLVDGNLKVQDDVAAALGRRVFIDVVIGRWAVEDDDDLSKYFQTRKNCLPLKAFMWSDASQGEAAGFLSLRTQKFELARPMKLEMDLSPAVAQLYLARVNPLLGEIVGPAVQDEDMPDLVIYISSERLMLPSESFQIDMEPMKAVLARGPLAGGILSLLSRGKEKITKQSEEVSVQTSHITAHVNMDGSLKCSRIDILIAEKIAIATWGVVNWIDEAVKMTIAIPSVTFNNVFGLQLSEGYFLKIPVGGTFTRPKVDWRAAAFGIAQLSLKQKGGAFLKGFLPFFNDGESVPEPVEQIPWIQK